MAGLMEGQNRLGVFIHPFAHNEKGGLNAVLAQNVDKLLDMMEERGLPL